MSKPGNDIARHATEIDFAHLRQQSEAAKYSREIMELSQALAALGDRDWLLPLRRKIYHRLCILLGVADETDK